MKVFSVFGITNSGKTTTVEHIIRELKKRRYSVGSVKDIHFEAFAIDTEGTNTDRHRKAGSELVTAWGIKETDILIPTRLSLTELLKFYHHDYVVVEGESDRSTPKIITAHTEEEIDERLDGTVFAIAGRISQKLTEYKGIPVINAMENAEALVDLIEDIVFDKLPDFKPDCCSACGFSCADLAARMLRGEADYKDCLVLSHLRRVELTFDGKPVDMVPFVQSILYNAVQGVVKELEGYKPGAKLEIKIGEI